MQNRQCQCDIRQSLSLWSELPFGSSTSRQNEHSLSVRQHEECDSRTANSQRHAVHSRKSRRNCKSNSTAVKWDTLLHSHHAHARLFNVAFFTVSFFFDLSAPPVFSAFAPAPRSCFGLFLRLLQEVNAIFGRRMNSDDSVDESFDRLRDPRKK